MKTKLKIVNDRGTIFVEVTGSEITHYIPGIDVSVNKLTGSVKIHYCGDENLVVSGTCRGSLRTNGVMPNNVHVNGKLDVSG